MKLNIRITLLIILLPSFGYGQDDIKHHAHEDALGVEKLSPDLRDLLSQEMKALQSGMMSIIPAYVSGDWVKIENTAKKMNNSYILKQSLTEDQIKELHSVLPHEFIEKDQEFHYLAEMLEHSARNKKVELINFYFAKMNDSCVNCHAVFATHKFPALAPNTETKHKH